MKVVTAALDARAPVESLYVAHNGRNLPPVAALVERALASGARVFDLGPGIMERVADAVTPQPVCAVIPMLDVPLAELVSRGEGGAERLLVVCVEVRDPGNLGAIVRSATGAGAAGVVCCGSSADLYNPKTVRATAGTVFELPLAVCDSPRETLETLRAAGFRRLATAARGGEDYGRADLSGDVALVLGNEAAGLSGDLLAATDGQLTIPMAGGAESLNVAMTAAILCHEIARRRRLL